MSCSNHGNLVFDILIITAALPSSWLWWSASRNRVRRISRHEVLDAADINRLVIALNRTQILNARAALATAVAAVLTEARPGVSTLPPNRRGVRSERVVAMFPGSNRYGNHLPSRGSTNSRNSRGETICTPQ